MFYDDNLDFTDDNLQVLGLIGSSFEGKTDLEYHGLLLVSNTHYKIINIILKYW